MLNNIKLAHVVAGIVIDTTSSVIATFSSFDSIYNPKFSAAQVVQFCKKLDRSVSCLVMTDESLQESLVAYDQVFRRFLQNDDGPPRRIAAIVDMIHDSDIKSLNEDIIKYLLDNEIILEGQVWYHTHLIFSIKVMQNMCSKASSL